MEKTDLPTKQAKTRRSFGVRLANCVTRYLKEGKRLKGEVEKVHRALRETNKVNKQV